MQMFFLYQILYKFGAGISKIATCFLLLAISIPQMKWFNRTCKALILYITGYCVSCSIATIFQCGTHVRSNWVHTDDQSHCFSKPPFWYAHAGLNIFASVLIAALPWWLFYYVTYKRKVTIGLIMSALSIA
jgi:LRP1 type putative zinc finger protein